MALDQAAVIKRFRVLAASVTGVVAAYSAADVDEYRLPEALADLPAVLVMPGPTIAYILVSGAHRHTYEVLVQVMDGRAEPGENAGVVSVMPDRFLEKFLLNVGLGGLCNSCVFKRSEGLKGIAYGGVIHSGYELVFECSEQASAAPAIGS